MKKEKAQTGARPVGANCVRPHIEGMAKNNVGVAPLGDPHSRGITLIALIITIIVMLILVGVSVTVALNGGLFTIAKDAANETKIKRDEELKLSEGKVQINGEWYDSMAEYANGSGNGGQQGGSTSDVTFKLRNNITGVWDTFTAPADAVWGDLFELYPEVEYTWSDDSTYLYVIDQQMVEMPGATYTCPNATGGGTLIQSTTLIADAPIPHSSHCTVYDSGIDCYVCNLEFCPYYDSDLLPEGS